MNDKPQKLWTKHTSFFVVEIKVGKTWVQHRKVDTESNANAESDKALRDASVSAVRVLEHQIVHVCTLMHQAEQRTELRVVPSMKLTNQKHPCPRCHIDAPVAYDGTFEWVLCAACNVTLPR